MKNGVFEIINGEGQICWVDTTDSSKPTYGKTWEKICESTIHGKIIEAVIDRPQFKTCRGETVGDSPVGYIVTINGEVEAFLPGSLRKSRDDQSQCSENKIAVVIEEFDPLSRSIVVKEVATCAPEFDVDVLERTYNEIANAHKTGKYVRGTIVGEKLNGGLNRAGYVVSINGLETFLPCGKSLIAYFSDIEMIIGTNVVCSVIEIDSEKLDIILSMKSSYQEILSGQPRPVTGVSTKGLVGWVTPYNVGILLPKDVLGILPRWKISDVDRDTLMEMTGLLIECIPYQVKIWDEEKGDFQLFVNPINTHARRN